MGTEIETEQTFFKAEPAAGSVKQLSPSENASGTGELTFGETGCRGSEAFQLRAGS
jgi:hypothetical protein